MSVVLGKRKESSMEFLKVARDIEVTLIDMRMNKPKRYIFFMDRLFKLSSNILSEVKIANSIYPENKSEVELRRWHLKEGIGLCQALVSQIEVIACKFKDDGISIGQVQQLSEMLTTEIRLIKGVIESDKKRYKKLLKGQELSE